MSNKNPKQHISLLSNEPCREDAFEGRAHKNIAVQVARIIREDDKCHIIGIEGGWGSGKSNLISLANKTLNGEHVYDVDFVHKDSSHPFFVYDAWGHQADYQRRAILEELTAELTNQKKILDSQKWNTKLEELLAKRKKTTTKEVPRLGIGLVVSIAMTIFTPLVVYIVGLIPEKLWWLKLIVAVSPYIAAVVYAIFDRINSLKKNGQEVTRANILSELILVYKDQVKENETYTTISEKEPSSSEFKAWMDDVDKDLVALGKNLVIVFDNMDRLPSQKVESLWSSIHSFFSDKTYDNIKVIIPFDRQHIQQAFKGEDTEDISYGNDFINKTFDVVFRVPPPIMTGWQHYMEDMWKKAFGKDAELHISVTQIYDALRKHHTPRKIIAFINEMATIKMTMGDSIPDKYIALFIFGKEKIDKDPIGQLLNPEFLGEIKFEYEKDPDTIKYLSALYYQLPPEQALDVVFTKEATDSLNSGNAERLHEMMEHIDLPPILGNAILKVTEVEKAANVLAELDSFYGYSGFGDIPEWLKQIWDALYQKCVSLDKAWNEIKEFHVSLFSHLYDENLADKLVKGYLSISDDKWNPALYVATIDKLRANNDIVDRKLEQYKRKVTPKLFLELLKYTSDNYKDYGVNFDLSELDTYLAGLEQNEVLPLGEIPCIGIKKDSLPNYKAKLQEWLGDTRALDVDRIRLLFDRLKEISEKPLEFEEYFSDSSIYSVWLEISNGENPFKYDLIAMRIARRDDMSSTYSSSFNDIIQEFNDKDAEALAEVIEYYISFGELILQSVYYKRYPLVCSVVELLVTKNYGEKKASVMDCLTHFDQAVDDYEIEAKLLFTRLNDWISYVKFTKVKVESLPSGLMEVAGEVDNNLSNAIHEACEAHFAEQTQDQWREHILNKNNTYRIWKIYHPKKYQANFDALKAELKGYANETISNQPDKNIIDEWLTVCMELKHSVKGLFNEISSILKRGLINKAKLLFFGNYILDYADTDKQNDFVIQLIPTEIIDVDVVSFIAERIDILKKCEISEEFKEKIKHLAETTMKDDERILTVCQNFGVDLVELKESK